MLGIFPIMPNESFRDQVVSAIQSRGWKMKQAARETGVSYDVIRELHRRPSSTTGADNARKLAQVLGIAFDEADGTSEAFDVVEPGDVAPPGTALVPVYDVAASAGPGSFVDGYEAVAASLALPPDYLRRITRAKLDDLAIISVKGDSMLPTLKDDDIVMLDRSKTDTSYDGLFVLRFGGALHVKRISRGSSRDTILIISDNPRYKDQEWPIEGVEVIGKVIWVGGKV